MTVSLQKNRSSNERGKRALAGTFSALLNRRQKKPPSGEDGGLIHTYTGGRSNSRISASLLACSVSARSSQMANASLVVIGWSLTWTSPFTT